MGPTVKEIIQRKTTANLGRLEEETVEVETLLEAWVEFGSGREQERLGEEEGNALGYGPQSGGVKGVEAGKGGTFNC